MADRYWVGGTANWDGTAGTKWATTSGGPGGAAVPTSADDVFFDGASGAVTVSVPIGIPSQGKSLNFTGFTGTFAGNGSVSIVNNVTFVAGMTVTFTGSLGLTGTGTLISAGKTLGALNISGNVTLGDALTLNTSAAITITFGSLNTANYAVSALTLSTGTTSAKTIDFGSSTVTLSGNLDFRASTGLTFNAGTSTIVMTNTGPALYGGPEGGAGSTFYNVSFTSTVTPPGTVNIYANNTFNNLSVSAPSSAEVREVIFTSPQTINGTLSTTGTAGNRRVWFRGGFSPGIAQTLTINSAPSLTDADFRDIYVVGTAAPISGTRIGNLRGCRGITFSTPKTVYWNFAGTRNWSDNGWSDTSTGSPNTNFFPLAQDTATFTNAGSVTGTITMDSAVPYTGTVDMSGRTSAMTLSIGTTFTIYGDWKNGSGTTLSGLSALTFSGRNTQNITSAGKTFSGPITVDSYGGTVQLVDALNIGSNNLTLTNGTFDTKNFNVTAGLLDSSSTNIRTINLGSSTATFSGTGSTLSATNLTFNAGTSTINIGTLGGSIGTSAGTTGLTFYNVVFTSTSAGASGIIGINTFNNLTLTAPASAGISALQFSDPQTITGTLTVAGASPVRRCMVRSTALDTTRTLTVGTLSATDCDFRDITIAGAAAGSSPTRAGDCGGNSGITFPAPKTVYWNLAGTQNWGATAWAPGTGGTPDINNFPLAQDTAVFDNTGSAGTITINLDWNIGTFDASARTSAMTLSSTASPFIYSDWKLGTGVTVSSTGSFVNFAKRGTQTITSNGVSINFQPYLPRPSTVVQLADALVVGSNRFLWVAGAGATFDAVSYNVTAGTFTASSGTIIKMGSGTWTITGTSSVWSVSTGTTLYKGTANIVLSDTSTSARTFAGGDLVYNKLTIGGTTGTSTTTISGNNSFTELASTKTVAHTIALGSSQQEIGKWSITGTSGNVVTVTGSSLLTILGPAVTGVDYLAMGTTNLNVNSAGEFYAGANSTGTGSRITLTAAPAARTLYWVGGTGNWSSTTKWSTSSGGPSGANIPTTLDDVVFNSASNATAYTATVDTFARCKSLTVAGPLSGNLTFAGTSGQRIICNGNVNFAATGLTITYTSDVWLSGNTSGLTFTSNGQSFGFSINVLGVNSYWTLGDAFSTTGGMQLNYGTLDTSSYNFTITNISSNVGYGRTLTFGSGTITITSGNIDFGTTEQTRANLSFNKGTSQLTCSNTSFLSGNNQTFHNVSFTSTSAGTVTINGANSFNNLSFTGITSAGLKQIALAANQTITGTLTLSAGTNATMRHFVRSDTLGTTRTLTVAAFSGTDVDFRDITVTGAAAPISGTRLGDAKGNSGITFPSPKTVYVRSTGSANWSSSTGWSATSGGAADVTQFPLAQDTAVFPAATYPSSGSTITIDQAYNIGTIDMSLRTSNTVTLATGSTTPAIYGNWINGTGTTLTGTGAMTFAGRGSQTITSAGKTFTQRLTIHSLSGSVTLQDSLISSAASAAAIQLTSGTFDAVTYNVTLEGFDCASLFARTLAIGSGTWTLTGGWSVGATLQTITGTGTIKLTSGSAKTFVGGGVSYSGITLDQGGAGTLTITGNNTFKDITNSYKATGATAINFGTTTQRVSQFTAAGEAGRILTIQGTSASSPGTLVLTGGTKPNVDYLTITGLRAYSLEDTWYAGANSTNNGSLGWIFSALPSAGGTGNFFLVFG